MDPECLRHRLTEAERREFNDNGMFLLENALSPKEVATLTELVDRTYAKQVVDGHDPRKMLFYPNFIADHPEFAELVDNPRVLPKVWGILGWNIYLYHAHYIVTPPAGEARDTKTFGFHQDSGRVNDEIECHPRPRLSLKVGYFLSDGSVEGGANLWVVPKSHLWDTLEKPGDGLGQPAGAEPVLVEPGTAVIIDRRLWHASTPNWSEVTRKVLYYGYGYRWIRTKDDMTVRELWPHSSPVRRQLLGDGVNANGHYNPTDADVPLRMWLREHSPDDAK